MVALPLFERLARALAGRYALVREIGHGGMGAVYLATDLKLDRQVAIKVLPPQTREILGPERFRREVQLAAQLSHPHIVPLFEADDADGCLFYVMEYVEGETLAARLKREGPLSVDEALRITAEVGDALQYAHERGVVHRDVKPANILLSRTHALVADFGVAKPAGGPREDTLTGTGVAVGTAEYMSPEQASGEKRIDARSDVYGLASVLYEMLAGEPPFTGPSVQAIIARVIAEPPRPIHTIRPNLPPHVEYALTAGLAKLPADRPASAQAFIDMLVRPTAERRARPTPRRRVLAVVLGAAVLGVGATFLLTRTRGRVPDSPPGMVVVAGGSYRLFGGDCPRCLPERAVTVASFYIDRTEVTVGEYAPFVATGAATAPWREMPSAALPVTGVMWAEAERYCRWRDAAARLPTEEEWEAAARGPGGWPFPWGATWEAGRANADNARGGLASVGSFGTGASPAGALDLIGNAWEWTASPGTAGRTDEPQYVIRGGGFNSPRTVATAYFRAMLPATVAEARRLEYFDKTGFRCARPVR